MAKILVVEDDIPLAEFIKTSLQSGNHHVDHLTDGTEGLWWLKNNFYDVAIVDWGLPGMAGVELCKEYRRSGGTTPILMLTGKQEPQDLVNGLDSGADDYVTKPFRLEELRARINSLLRRTPPTVKSKVTKIESVEIDSVAGTVTVDGVTVELNRKEFAILDLLMRNPGVLFSPELIMNKAWPADSESSADTVRCHVAKVRKKLEDARYGSAHFIKTIYGRGYKAEIPLCP